VHMVDEVEGNPCGIHAERVGREFRVDGVDHAREATAAQGAGGTP
jgi:hypothetical protein